MGGVMPKVNIDKFGWNDDDDEESDVVLLVTPEEDEITPRDFTPRTPAPTISGVR